MAVINSISMRVNPLVPILLEMSARSGLYSKDPPESPVMEENNVQACRRTTFALNIASGFPFSHPEVNFRPGVILPSTI